ncbi:MAG TPA: ATP-binding protein [Candidatus Onthocola stercorigallinarum]|nr:ATP-binding protein [Candidatus Onthocola stercorigallinarum]
MKRKVYYDLLEWKKNSNGKTAMLIEGARRVGKSYIALEFAKNNYKNYVLINFSKVSDDVKNIFNNYLDKLDDFFLLLSSYYGVELYERETLFIFDEIQFFPRAREAIKFLVEDGRYDYLETGSLISIKKNVKDILIPSEEESIVMYPMDFEEFLWAMGRNTLMDYIREHFENRKSIGPLLHRTIMDYFNKYMIVGGMPQAVLEFSATNSFASVDKIKRSIIKLYRDDIRKHAEELNLKVEQIFDTIPAQLAKHEKRFNLATLDENARYRDYEGAFYFLEDAGIINIAYNTTEPNIGLGQRLDSNSLKCYMNDTGLLLSMTFNEREIISEEIYKKILFNKLTFNNGMIIENIVAQMLVASKNKLYFFSRNNREDASETMEIDFLLSKSAITSKHNIIPIEVKSSKNYTYSSLNKLISKYKDYLAQPIIIHTSDLKIENNILYLPIYMTMLL